MPPAPVSRDGRERALEAFQRCFGAPPSFLVRAPGRVNLIGDHTDYNDGFVLPMAIDRAAWIALRPRTDGRVAIQSLDLDEGAEFPVAGPTERGALGGWIEYLRGIAWVLREARHAVRGWEGVVAGDVPVGAGLSSSAALELAAARAFCAVGGWGWDATAMARLAQRAENEWVGVNCGIMDQLISAAGRAGHALLIDCRSLDTRPVPIPRSAAVVVLDTGTRRGLAQSAYNERRADCQRAAARFGVPALRDVDLAVFTAGAPQLDDVTRRRARHVVTENARTRAAAAALARGDVTDTGMLMNESHASLRDDFEVSCRELDVMVALAQSDEHCHGARMTGAGFGGCAVALVVREAAPVFSERVAAAYARAVGRPAAVYVCEPSAGASVEVGAA